MKSFVKRYYWGLCALMLPLQGCAALKSTGQFDWFTGGCWIVGVLILFGGKGNFWTLVLAASLILIG